MSEERLQLLLCLCEDVMAGSVAAILWLVGAGGGIVDAWRLAHLGGRAWFLVFTDLMN